ncbi:coilin-like [Sinocyclocheilus anshuiensis]|uniref:Rab11 family-interacting protein 4A n=1 Tax=Sinocyclocheilus anshuiensis TaxID=1608454 RepID=A0A671M0Y7_9TELE|nr:PREDICTED: coilin-like [Sinocyclocheilus anshuiensis]
MATSSLSSVRVRLYFDYTPPATPECRMCWLLVDLNKCRVVADLSSIIKEKFGYSRRTILDLFIEDCYLPSTESIYIVRDNDSIRVKASNAVYINGEEVYQNSEAQNSKTKKRGRDDETQISKGLSKKKKHEGAQINGSAPAEDAKKKKKKKKEVKESAAKPATPQKNTETPSSTKNNRKGISAVPTSDKTTRAKTQQPTSSSSDSSEDESHSKAPPPKPKPKQNGTAKKPRKESTSSSDDSDTEKPKSNVPVQSLPVTPKLSSTTSKLPLQTPQRRESSTDSSSSSSSPSQARPTAKKSQVATQPSSATAQSVSSSVSKKPQDKAESSDSEASEIELVIKKPNLQGMGLKIAGLSPGVSEASGRDRGNTRGQERGRGRGANRGSGRGGFGRAKGTPWKQDLHYNYENGERQKQNDSLTNESFILQNPPEIAPRRDYAALPLLAAPPAVGQKIAFKLLELTENYTPEVSDYKEGKIIAFDPQTKVMELELLSQPQAPAEPGKFDLVYQSPDGSERVEYAVTHGSQLTERWDSLLEPRLIVENVG